MSANAERMNDPSIFRGAEAKQLNTQEKERVTEFKKKALEFTSFIETHLVRGEETREIKVAREHLEDAVMWLTKFLTKEQNGYQQSQR